jgi:formamidopyrimidine-DNA glycosylase
MVMGGHPQRGGASELPNKYTHIIINFSDGSTLYFNDLRKFGWMRVLDDGDLQKIESNLGIEALDSKFNLKKFEEIINRYPRRNIKQLLLDQKLIAGIGNIYADESCFCAGILPTRVVGKINKKEANKLLLCIKKILKLAISKGGTSSDTYVQLTGKPGGFVPYLKV